MGRNPEPWRPKELLVVSGFAGAGKSTFILQMRKGNLPDDIRVRLPLRAESWAEISATEARALAQIIAEPGSTGGSPDSGAILHYPIDQFQRGGLRPYQLDPVFASLPTVDRVIVVVLCVSPRQLIAQFSDRIAKKVRRRGWRGELIHQLFRIPLRAIRRSLRANETLTPDPSLYTNIDWFRGCLNTWDQFLKASLDAKPNSSVHYIKPILTDIGEPSFVLLDPAERTDALTDD